MFAEILAMALPAAAAALFGGAFFAGYSPERRRHVHEGDASKDPHLSMRKSRTGSATQDPPFETSGDTGDRSAPEVVQPTVNDICPLDENRVDPTVPKRDFQGEFVGFCSRDCAAEWDKLDIEQKRDRLEGVDEINE